MHSVVKAFLGLILVILGIAWYLIGVVFMPGWSMTITSFFHALAVVFIGIFGLLLLLVGVILLWLGVEDMRAPSIKEYEAEMEEKPVVKPSTVKKSPAKKTVKKATKKAVTRKSTRK